MIRNFISAQAGQPECLHVPLRVALSALREREIANPANQLGVAECRDTSHARQSGGRRDVGIRVHLEQPGPAGLIDAEIAPTVSLTADYAPGSASDERDLPRKIFR